MKVIKRLRVPVGVVFGVIATVLVGCASFSSQPKYTAEQVMEQGFKGDDSLIKKVTQGKGTQDDFKRLSELVNELAKNKPTKGDMASWKEKTSALSAAAKNLVQGTPGALDSLKAASNCKACHSVHKPS